MEKPAADFLLVINEAKEVINLIDDHSEHGKVVSIVPSISNCFEGDPGGVAGLYVATKRDLALIGTQTGYGLQLDDSRLNRSSGSPACKRFRPTQAKQ